jgi:CRP-like cAMP-binding protein
LGESHALHQIPLFATLDEVESARLMSIMKRECYRAGQTILREGDSGDCLPVVVDGSVRILTNDLDGGEVLLA